MLPFFLKVARGWRRLREWSSERQMNLAREQARMNENVGGGGGGGQDTEMRPMGAGGGRSE